MMRPKNLLFNVLVLTAPAVIYAEGFKPKVYVIMFIAIFLPLIASKVSIEWIKKLCYVLLGVCLSLPATLAGGVLGFYPNMGAFFIMMFIGFILFCFFIAYLLIDKEIKIYNPYYLFVALGIYTICHMFLIKDNKPLDELIFRKIIMGVFGVAMCLMLAYALFYFIKLIGTNLARTFSNNN